MSTTSKRVGRPPLADNDPSANVQLRVPGSLYDRIYAEASRERLSVPDIIRRALERDFVTENLKSDD